MIKLIMIKLIMIKLIMIKLIMIKLIMDILEIYTKVQPVFHVRSNMSSI